MLHCCILQHLFFCAITLGIYLPLRLLILGILFIYIIKGAKKKCKMNVAFCNNATNATIKTGKINISFARNEMFDYGA